MPSRGGTHAASGTAGVLYSRAMFDDVTALVKSSSSGRARPMRSVSSDRGTGIDGPLLGCVNFSEVVPGVFQACYMGYALAETARGHGYIAEACRAGVTTSLMKFACTGSWPTTCRPTTAAPRSFGAIVRPQARRTQLLSLRPLRVPAANRSRWRRTDVRRSHRQWDCCQRLQ